MAGEPPSAPVQLVNYDLTKERPNGRQPNSPPMTNERSDYRNPAAMMRDMGFDPNTTMTPLQFLVAVYNDDLEKVYRSEKKRKEVEDKGGIGMSYRLEAAKTATKFVHMEMPKIQINEGETSTYGDKLVQAGLAGNERLRTRQMIIETVERISPDAPLSEAIYPPIYNQKPEHDDAGRILLDGEYVKPEGDKDYNPDAE